MFVFSFSRSFLPKFHNDQSQTWSLPKKSQDDLTLPVKIHWQGQHPFLCQLWLWSNPNDTNDSGLIKTLLKGSPGRPCMSLARLWPYYWKSESWWLAVKSEWKQKRLVTAPNLTVPHDKRNVTPLNHMSFSGQSAQRSHGERTRVVTMWPLWH